MDTSDETFNVSALLFAKYQMRIHREPPDECDEETFTEFLVDSPLKVSKNFFMYFIMLHFLLFINFCDSQESLKYIN